MADPTSASQGIDVTYVADLARLRLSPEEIATFQKQLGDVLGYVSQLQEVDVSHVTTSGDADLKNVLRADVLAPSLTPAQALANAPRQDNNLFVVPRVIEG
jgi:aspartyl-tRNA(Asn)/glutamyl-tRNA(Gln) amidotransferase subunit C